MHDRMTQELHYKKAVSNLYSWQRILILSFFLTMDTAHMLCISKCFCIYFRNPTSVLIWFWTTVVPFIFETCPGTLNEIWERKQLNTSSQYQPKTESKVDCKERFKGKVDDWEAERNFKVWQMWFKGQSLTMIKEGRCGRNKGLESEGCRIHGHWMQRMWSGPETMSLLLCMFNLRVDNLCNNGCWWKRPLAHCRLKCERNWLDI